MLIAGVCNAQEVIDKKKSKKDGKDYPKSTLPVAKLDRLLGVTKLTAMEKVLDDPSFVDYLKENPNFELKERVEGTELYYDHVYEDDGVTITTRRTGFSIETLDHFVEEIAIWNRKGRKLPFSGDVDMNAKEYGKKLKACGFKPVKSKNTSFSRAFKGYFYERPNATVEIFYSEGQFSQLKIKANFDYIFGGKLIK